MTYTNKKVPIDSYMSNHRFVADGKLYLPGNLSGADNSDNWSLLSTTDLVNFNWEFQNRRTDIYGKLDLPNGKSVYIGSRAYVDNPDMQAEQMTYYYWMEDFSNPTPTMYPIMPTLTQGVAYPDGSRGDVYFYYPMFTTPIVRNGYLYWPLVVYQTQYDRIQEWSNNITTGKFIRIVKISIEDFMLGKYWSKVADIKGYDLIGSEGGDETTWIEYPDGEVVILTRTEFGDNVSTYGGGISVSRSIDLINWSAPAIGYDGYPSTGFVDYDGTTYAGASQRVYKKLSDHSLLGDSNNHLITSIDKLITHTDEAINTFSVYGYNGAVRFKDKLIQSYATTGSVSGYDTYLNISDLPVISTFEIVGSSIISGNTQLNALINSQNVVTNHQFINWHSSDPTVATVYKGQVTSLKNGTITITAEYFGNIVTKNITVNLLGRTVTIKNSTQSLSLYNYTDLTNPSLFIYFNNQKLAFSLVDTTDINASNVRIKTPQGIKAIAK